MRKQIPLSHCILYSETYLLYQYVYDLHIKYKKNKYKNTYLLPSIIFRCMDLCRRCVSTDAISQIGYFYTEELITLFPYLLHSYSTTLDYLLSLLEILRNVIIITH